MLGVRRVLKKCLTPTRSAKASLGYYDTVGSEFRLLLLWTEMLPVDPILNVRANYRTARMAREFWTNQKETPHVETP